MRTLEQKISDAGPGNQRVDPHNLTKARKLLAQDRIVDCVHRPTGRWYRLSTTPLRECMERLERVEPILTQMQAGENHLAVGQTLEIAVFRALQTELENHSLTYFGGFRGIDSPNPADWKKIEPPAMVSGKSLPGDQLLDFVIVDRDARVAGIEVKNMREWIYPDSEEMLALLGKCCDLDAVPVLICRRYAYATFSVMHRCGVLLHQNYNQLLPSSLRELAKLARHKDSLGYHDIRLGNDPDRRLRRFIGTSLPRLLPEAKHRFDKFKDLLCAFAHGHIDFEEFDTRSRQR